MSKIGINIEKLPQYLADWEAFLNHFEEATKQATPMAKENALKPIHAIPPTRKTFFTPSSAKAAVIAFAVDSIILLVSIK